MTDCLTPKRAILAPLHANTSAAGHSPVSPMANLKLLTKVAAGFDDDTPTTTTTSYQVQIVPNVPEITEEDDDYNECCASLNLGGGNLAMSGGAELVTSTRRFRSLNNIFREFLTLYPLKIPENSHKILSIVQLSKQLRVEKRRVYDVINVVICLHMAFKVCKDRYQWHGNQHLSQALSLLKMYALYRNLDAKLTNLISRATVDEQPIDETIPFEEKSFFEDNRIGALCQKFMMLILVTPQGECLSLPLASKLILTSDIQFKTGMRRLYDIANALAALGLIVKSERKDAGKPYFKYSGPKIEVNAAFVDRSDWSNQRFNFDINTSAEARTDGTVSSQISSSTDSVERGFVKITPKMNPFDRVRECAAIGEPSAKKRLAFPKPCSDREDVENPSFAVTTVAAAYAHDDEPEEDDNSNDGTRRSITYIRSPFALKGYVSTKPASLVVSERKKFYSQKIRIQPRQAPEPAVTVVDNETDAVILPGLQDGGIYKAYKVGDTFKLVKL